MKIVYAKLVPNIPKTCSLIRVGISMQGYHWSDYELFKDKASSIFYFRRVSWREDYLTFMGGTTLEEILSDIRPRIPDSDFQVITDALSISKYLMTQELLK